MEVKSSTRHWISEQWRDISGNAKFAIILAVGTAIMSGATALIHGLEGWQQVVLVALFTLLFGWALIATALIGRTNRTRNRNAVTLENIEERLQDWLSSFHLRNQRHNPTPEVHFLYKVDGPFGQPISISRPRSPEQERYLNFGCGLLVPKSDHEIIHSLGEHGVMRFVNEFLAECSQARAKITAIHTYPFGAAIVRRLPITPDLTADGFWNAFDLMQQDMTIAANNLSLCLQRAQDRHAIASRPQQPSPPTPDTAASPPSPTS